MKKNLLIITLLFFAQIFAQEANWKRIPGSPEKLWNERGRSAEASLAAVNLDEDDIFSADSFMNLIEEDRQEGRLFGIMQVVYILPSGEAASYYAAVRWQDFVKSLEAPMVRGYGLAANPDLLEELGRQHHWSPEFIEELSQADPEEQIDMLVEKRVPAATVDILRNAFLKEYKLPLVDAATKQNIIAQHEFFISRPDGHLWPTQELARLENIFLTHVDTRNFVGARLILDQMAGLGEQRIIGDFIEDLWMTLPDAVRQRHEKEEVKTEEISSLKRIPGSSDEDWKRGARIALFDLRDNDGVANAPFLELMDDYNRRKSVSQLKKGEELVNGPFCIVQVRPEGAGAQYYSCESWDGFVAHASGRGLLYDPTTRGYVSPWRDVSKFYIGDPRGHLWDSPVSADQEESILKLLDQSNNAAAQKMLAGFDSIVEHPRYDAHMRELSEMVRRKFEAVPKKREVVLSPEVGPEEPLEEIGPEDRIMNLITEGNLDVAKEMIARLPDEEKQFELMLELSAQEERFRHQGEEVLRIQREGEMPEGEEARRREEAVLLERESQARAAAEVRAREEALRIQREREMREAEEARHREQIVRLENEIRVLENQVAPYLRVIKEHEGRYSQGALARYSATTPYKRAKASYAPIEGKIAALRRELEVLRR